MCAFHWYDHIGTKCFRFYIIEKSEGEKKHHFLTALDVSKHQDSSFGLKPQEKGLFKVL